MTQETWIPIAEFVGYDVSDMGRVALAAQLGVSTATIVRVRRMEIWRHVS